MPPVQALTFDIGGTVFDWMTAITTAVAPIARGRPTLRLDATAFAVDLRAGFLDLYGAVCRGDRDWMNADAIYEAALEDVLARHGVSDPMPEERRGLRRAWHAMPAWPDAPAALAALRARYVLAPLTILSWSMAVDSSKAAGVVWDGILSCDLLGVYKPDPRCYARAAEVMGCPPGRIMMVAAHPSDLRAAQAVGYRTAYVRPRLEDPGEDYADTGFAQAFELVAEDFADLARRLP